MSEVIELLRLAVEHNEFGRNGKYDFYGSGQLPFFPTQAAPGSPEKVAVMAERARARQQLFHPQDRGFVPLVSPPPKPLQTVVSD